MLGFGSAILRSRLGNRCARQGSGGFLTIRNRIWPAVPHARLVAATLALAALAGCASVGPEYREPTLPVRGDWLGAGRVTTAPTGDLPRWWEQFGDAALSGLVAAALQGSLDLRVAQSRLRQARARREAAGADQFPTLTGSLAASRAKSAGFPTTRLYSAGFDASWEPDVFGGTRRAIEAAGADLQASEADLHSTQVSLAAEVAFNYIELRAFQARRAIARSSLEAQSETLQLTDWL